MGSHARAQVNAVDPQPVVRVEEVRIVPDAGSSVGRMSAGKLCLPSGAVRLFDIVANQRQLMLIAQAAVDEITMASPATGPRIFVRVAISIEEIDVKFCQRKYGAFGMGDRRSLSGRAKFGFAWKQLDNPGTPWIYHSVDVRPANGETRTIEQFLPEALRLLVLDSILTAR